MGSLSRNNRRRSRLMPLILALAGLAGAGSAGGQQAPPVQATARPILPEHERLVYSRTIGKAVDTVVVECRLVSGKDGSWYEVSSGAPDQDSIYRLDPRTLFADYMDITSSAPDSTIRRVTTVLENRAKAGPEDILVSTFETLPYTLRAFPWDTRQKAHIVFLGAGRGMMNFSFDLSVAGKESLSVDSSKIECWKVQLSVGGVMGALVGKSYFWFAADYPHYLVRSESSSAGPGSPSSVLSLVSYSSGS